MNEHLFEARRQRLRGMELTFAWKGYSSAYFLEFGNIRYGFFRNGKRRNFPTGEMSVFLSWSWRVEYAHKIVCGSWSDDDDWKAVFDNLIGSTVLEINHFGKLPELELELSNGFRLLSFMTVEDGPDWTISNRKPSGEKDLYLQWRDGIFVETASSS
jgi:hypothetical protein